MLVEASERLLRALRSANRMSIRFSVPSSEDKAYFYSFKNYVYISVSMRELNPKSSGYKMAVLLIASSFLGVRGRIRLLATLLASVALLFLNGFVPLGTVVTAIMIAAAVALLVLAFVIARNLGRVSVSNEEAVEELHERLYSTNMYYRSLFNSIKEFSARIVSLVADVAKGKKPSSVHIPSIGIYRVEPKRSGEVIELELNRVITPPQPATYGVGRGGAL
ncbi:MAG: hypothetical protein GXO32_07450 [Crenarchaeota archaeon]|nr:hypothetical protein [Thermoproteota archaeon]